MPDGRAESSRSPAIRTFGLGFTVGLVASALPLAFTPRGEPRLFLLWVLALLLAAFGLGLSSPRPPRAWGLSVGLGLPVVVVARIVVDTIRLAQGAVWPETEEHTLFPLEILFALVIGLSAAFVGAYVGSLLRRLIARFRRNPPHGV